MSRLIRGHRETGLFREAMFMVLNREKNAAKGHWRGMSLWRLLWLQVVELVELVVAVACYEIARRRFIRSPNQDRLDRLEVARSNVLAEAADVGVFSLFVADNCQALESEVR